MVRVRAERLGKIIFLHAWLGLSVKKGTQLRAGGRWQIKAASFLTDLPSVRPGRARGGRNNGSHLQKNQPRAPAPGGEKTKRVVAAPAKAFQSPVGGGCGVAVMVVGTGSPWELGQCGICAAIRTHQEDVKAA